MAGKDSKKGGEASWSAGMHHTRTLIGKSGSKNTTAEGEHVHYKKRKEMENKLDICAWTDFLFGR